MNKKNSSKIWYWGLFIGFFIIGYLLNSIQWNFLSIIFFIISGIFFIKVFIGRNHESEKEKKLMCPKCQIGNSLYNLNNNPHSTIFIYKEQTTKTKLYDSLIIFHLICFKCRKITEWASDSNNSLETSKFGFKYFQTKVMTKKDIDDAILDAERSCSVDSLKKLKEIKEEIL